MKSSWNTNLCWLKLANSPYIAGDLIYFAGQIHCFCWLDPRFTCYTKIFLVKRAYTCLNPSFMAQIPVFLFKIHIFIIIPPCCPHMSMALARYRSDAPAAAEHAARETGLGDAMGRCGGKGSFWTNSKYQQYPTVTLLVGIIWSLFGSIWRVPPIINMINTHNHQ